MIVLFLKEKDAIKQFVFFISCMHKITTCRKIIGKTFGAKTLVIKMKDNNVFERT